MIFACTLGAQDRTVVPVVTESVNSPLLRSSSALPPLARPDSNAPAGSIQTYLSQADQFLLFGKKAAPAQAREAKRLEALALLFAQQLGDDSQGRRLEQAVAAVRRDPQLTAHDRYEVAALADHQKLARQQRKLTRGKRVAGLEQVERALVTEFPDQPDSYEALLHLAESELTGDEACRIARDLAVTVGPPTWVVTRAQTLLQRYALVGQPLARLWPTTVPALPAGGPVVLYSWSSDSPASLVLAQDLAKRFPAGTLFLGVCLDEDVVLGQSLADQFGLSGAPFYDAQGPQGLLAQRLMLNDAGLVYLADEGGVLRSVSAHLSMSSNP